MQNSVITSGRRVDRAEVLKFGEMTASYAVMEGALLSLVALASANAYWAFALGGVREPLSIAVASIVLGVGIPAFCTASGRYAKALDRGPGFLMSGIAVTMRLFGILVAVLFFAKMAEDYSRGALVAQLVGASVALLAARGVFQRRVADLLASGRLETKRVMVVGGPAVDEGFRERMSRGGARIVAFFPTSASDRDLRADEIVAACRKASVDQVVIHASGFSVERLDMIVESLAETPVTVQILPVTNNVSWQKTGSAGLGLPTAVINNSPISGMDLTAKRAFDILVSFCALVALAPVFVMIAIAIKLDSKGPVFFRQTRDGYGKMPILVYKFRSMRVLEDGAAFRQAKKNDPRITKVGTFLRRTNLDELPQILNVLFGEMSIVGPRPHPVALNETFSGRIRLFNRRHNIRPGITGWAQINGFRGETETLQKMASRVEHDLWYVDNWSFLLDLKIILMTVFSPVAYKNAG